MKKALLFATVLAFAMTGTVFADEEAAVAEGEVTTEAAAAEEEVTTEAAVAEEEVAAEETEAPATDESADEVTEEEVEEMAGEELIIESGDKSIYGVIYKPEEANGTLIIMSHGYNGTHNDWVQEGTTFAGKGYTAYAYDFCGGSVNSQSSGKSTEMTINTEKQDLLDVVDYFKSSGEFEKIFLLGGSQGGFVSSLVAAELKDEIGALAMYFPALCVPDDWKNNYPDPSEAPDTFDFWGMDLSREFVEDVQQIDVYGTIGDYKGDVLIIHGDEDPIVPYEYSERAAETYEHAELIKMEGEGHGWSPEAWPKAIEMVLEFFEAH